ncbi:family 1 glycosylhydrolase [Sphingomonas bacterium]|uniref:family 1 glycosylhydrolase n=1 Tax=Sphingomonas bacterium TaxID=1895847 RepID=UPI001576AFB4|nr:family 1 glycosylhydrolase [Sphingomonas bacterium]
MTFLDDVRRRFGDDDTQGDRHGGRTGESGAGLPDGAAGSFRFATGIECSYPMTQGGTDRRDQLAECGHYDRWREDLGLVHDLGLRTLRYGLPLHRIVGRDGARDWAFADDAMAEMRRLEIEPVLDLMHFGLPDAWGDYQNPELPVLFADYCAQVAARYPWVRCYTPVNEIYVTARNSGRDGLWNEQRRDDRSFVTALKHATAANILGIQAIARARPDCMIVQSETAECLHAATPVEPDHVRIANKLRFLSLDLLYANAPDAEMMLFLLDNGLTREEYAWFMAGEPPGYQVLGMDYYGRNERIVLPDGTTIAGEDVYGWHVIVREYYRRYRKPVFHTETNVFLPDAAPEWLWKQWINILAARDGGIPVLGFTWYSLTDQIDWDSQLAERNGTVIPCGLYDLDRKPRPVAAAYRQLLENFGRIGLMPHAELLTITDAPATLKVDV